MKETKATLSNLTIGPHKVKLVADLIRGMKAQEAVNVLNNTQKGASKPLRKLVESAMANAVNVNNEKVEDLLITRVDLGPSTTMKRIWPRSRGQADRISKRTSNLTVILVGKN